MPKENSKPNSKPNSLIDNSKEPEVAIVDISTFIMLFAALAGILPVLTVDWSGSFLDALASYFDIFRVVILWLSVIFSILGFILLIIYRSKYKKAVHEHRKLFLPVEKTDDQIRKDLAESDFVLIYRLFRALLKKVFVSPFVFLFNVTGLSRAQQPKDSEESSGSTTIPLAEKRWKKIVEQIGSENENDWKAAILQADYILDELLLRIGIKGESLGERLKRVDTQTFPYLDDAWSVHKVRNSIAHDGTVTLSQKEAKRIIGKYQKILKYYKYI